MIDTHNHIQTRRMLESWYIQHHQSHLNRERDTLPRLYAACTTDLTVRLSGVLPLLYYYYSMAGNFGGLVVLRAICQYFIDQIAAQCDVIIIAKSYQCVYTRPAARCTSLIVGIEFTMKSCIRGHHFSKEFFVHQRWEKSWQGEDGDPNDVYAVLLRLMGQK